VETGEEGEIGLDGVIGTEGETGLAVGVGLVIGAGGVVQAATGKRRRPIITIHSRILFTDFSFLYSISKVHGHASSLSLTFFFPPERVYRMSTSHQNSFDSGYRPLFLLISLMTPLRAGFHQQNNRLFRSTGHLIN
jgi:hypothetical protein